MRVEQVWNCLPPCWDRPHAPYGDDMRILSRVGEAGQLVRWRGDLSPRPRIADFAEGFISHLGDFCSCIVRSDAGGAQACAEQRRSMVALEGFPYSLALRKTSRKFSQLKAVVHNIRCSVTQKFVTKSVKKNDTDNVKPTL